MGSSRQPSWLNDDQSDEVKLKIENKYCEDFASALKFWDYKCIVDAYFNQTVSSTEEETKLKDRLRKKKFRQRLNSITLQDSPGIND